MHAELNKRLSSNEAQFDQTTNDEEENFYFFLFLFFVKKDSSSSFTRCACQSHLNHSLWISISYVKVQRDDHSSKVPETNSAGVWKMRNFNTKWKCHRWFWIFKIPRTLPKLWCTSSPYEGNFSNPWWPS